MRGRRRGVLGRRHPRHVGRPRHGHQLLVAHQPVEQLGVVHHLVRATHLRVLVLDRVEAVRAGDDDLGDAELPEGRHVLRGQRLEEQLVARPSRRVTGAGLAVAEHRERHPGGVEQLGHRTGRLLGAVLVGTRAADPEQPLDVRRLLDVLAEHLHGERQVLGPVEPRPGTHAPRVALALEVLEQPAQLRRERRLDQRGVAPHVDDVVDVLDVDRALLDAGAARGARPQHVLVDHGIRPVRVVGRERRRDVVARRADERQVGPRRRGTPRPRHLPARASRRRMPCAPRPWPSPSRRRRRGRPGPAGTVPWRRRGRAGSS